MKTIRKPNILAVALVCALAVAAHAADEKVKELKEIRKMAHDTLHRLYVADPPANAAIQRAAG